MSEEEKIEEIILFPLSFDQKKDILRQIKEWIGLEGTYKKIFEATEQKECGELWTPIKEKFNFSSLLDCKNKLQSFKEKLKLTLLVVAKKETCVFPQKPKIFEQIKDLQKAYVSNTDLRETLEELIKKHIEKNFDVIIKAITDLDVDKEIKENGWTSHFLCFLAHELKIDIPKENLVQAKINQGKIYWQIFQNGTFAYNRQGSNEDKDFPQEPHWYMSWGKFQKFYNSGKLHGSKKQLDLNALENNIKNVLENRDLGNRSNNNFNFKSEKLPESLVKITSEILKDLIYDALKKEEKIDSRNLLLMGKFKIGNQNDKFFTKDMRGEFFETIQKLQVLTEEQFVSKLKEKITTIRNENFIKEYASFVKENFLHWGPDIADTNNGEFCLKNVKINLKNSSQNKLSQAIVRLDYLNSALSLSEEDVEQVLSKSLGIEKIIGEEVQKNRLGRFDHTYRVKMYGKNIFPSDKESIKKDEGRILYCCFGDSENSAFGIFGSDHEQLWKSAEFQEVPIKVNNTTEKNVTRMTIPKKNISLDINPSIIDESGEYSKTFFNKKLLCGVSNGNNVELIYDSSKKNELSLKNGLILLILFHKFQNSENDSQVSRFNKDEQSAFLELVKLIGRDDISLGIRNLWDVGIYGDLQNQEGQYTFSKNISIETAYDHIPSSALIANHNKISLKNLRSEEKKWLTITVPTVLHNQNPTTSSNLDKQLEVMGDEEIYLVILTYLNFLGEYSKVLGIENFDFIEPIGGFRYMYRCLVKQVDLLEEEKDEKKKKTAIQEYSFLNTTKKREQFQKLDKLFCKKIIAYEDEKEGFEPGVGIIKI